MSNDDKARVRARGAALCPDFAAIERGVRRMLGRAYQEVSPGQWGWVPNGDDATPKSREVAYALADGDLYAADAATAAWASSVTGKSVKFDPSFGAAPVDSKESA